MKPVQRPEPRHHTSRHPLLLSLWALFYVCFPPSPLSGVTDGKPRGAIEITSTTQRDKKIRLNDEEFFGCKLQFPGAGLMSAVPPTIVE